MQHLVVDFEDEAYCVEPSVEPSAPCCSDLEMLKH